MIATALMIAAVGAGSVGIALTVAIRRRLRRIATARKRRDEHLARTAHELRTPLTAVINALEIVRSGSTDSAAEAAQFLDEADLAARHLACLVNDVLDEAAIATGNLRVDVRTIAVEESLRQATRVLGMQAARHNISVHTEQSGRLFVEADERRLVQVLFNLVGNALKFSPAGGVVRIDVTATENRVRFAVIDEGRGVPASLRPRLFEAFATDGDPHHSHGTGLGLHISRRLIEQMGGNIGHLPREPRGSEFWFELPRAVEANVAVTASARR